MAKLMAGLMGKCPRCGRGRLFKGFLEVRETCSNCHLGLKGHDSGDGPAVASTFLVGAIVIPLVLYAELTYEPPVWVHMVLWLPLGLALTIGSLRPLKGITVALQYKYRDTQRDSRPGGQ
ncbi:MAG: DUF983 domain-containing protein [Magnetovibrionaceae bacterium]